MTDTSTLTPFQELFNKLGTNHPQKQLLLLLERVEALEAAGVKPVSIIYASDEKVEPIKRKPGRPKKNDLL